eukprot:TRINITY_DN3282_c0_g2_i2.p1 TRINITY_DN3282_c0_g2~~TRINITY_DN3282_c0_g2_i2.p1  ORF type:complete len:513 (+),score=91.90 TRINITY_DN3282_c0_g2_i2:567-2105(+)
MSHRVPDFEEECSMPMCSRFLPQRKSIMAEEDELLELLWQNGQVVTQSQNQRCTKRSPPLRFGGDDTVPHGRPGSGGGDEIGSPATAAAASQLFLQEDEMASWLHYPIEETFDRDFCSDLVFSGSAGNSGVAGRNGQVQVDRKSEEKPPASAPAAAPSRPPIYPSRRRESAEGVVNFAHLSRGKGKGDSRPSDGRESTVVDSSETPAAGEARVRVFQGEKTVAGSGGGNAGCGSTCGGSREREPGTCEGALTSSSGVSSPSAEDRKRKARQGEESEWQSEDAEYESLAEKKVTRRSTSARRARAAEVHNLSERRRRDRINEKMKALQELIPRCNKSDKASMLDEAIEYLKSLQLQVQMMSMGCSMAPMMFPGVQQYMPAMGMGMGIGMGMEMAAATGFVRPMLPFPQVMSGPAMPGPSASHLSPRFPMPPFNLPHIPPSDQTRVQATNMLDPASTSVNLHCTNMPQQSPNLTDPYHHYLGLHHMQGPPQNQATAQQSITNKGVGTPENHQSG